MRIFIIHNFYQHAGGEDFVFRKEVAELSKIHDVKTYSAQNKKGVTGLLQYFSYPFNISESRDIMREIDLFQPDIVHIHNVHYAIGPWIIRRIAQKNIPIVMTLHNFRLLCPSATLFFNGQLFTKSLQQQFPWEAVKKRVLDHSLPKTLLTAFTYWWHRKIGTWNSVDRYIVLSQFAKDLFAHSTFPVSASKFVIRPNSADVQPTNQARTADFIYIGRLSEEKGILPLLEAMAETNYTIKVYGTGPQQARVEEMQDRYPNIIYMGFQPQEQLASALSTANALIVPSVCYEGMPMTIIEAFGYSTPVLASNIGILREMVLPLYTGLSFDPYNKEDIKDVLNQWDNLENKTKDTIGTNCRMVYEKNYTVKSNLSKLLEIYDSIKH
ncbi:glycosyltransferase family 4 protein [Sphingobacterium psychroaquaticum]|uniref:Glycosyltransferase involved in cell wall bisynthesis n=1 Tax=Sphingobacterium psychroaquaticum TaxID=561061 RepID=A0A1X7L6C8_9SPHI|nr:glycosyltransferase family 4 protein [Sphingobacterium psychroaquaticum]SMG49147.1 Glycosyltransferase involved in cell wall bisynthesis [Sphingobacterium psychroaquaticum]